MKILLVTQYFYPENFKSNDIAFEMAKRGYQVDVLTSIPNYPEGKYYIGYGVFKKRKEVINGVNIYRVFQTPRGKGGWKLPFNYFSFVVTSCISVILLFAWKKYDCVICHGTSPIFQAYPAILLKKIKKIPFYFWVLDIWPDAMMSGGGVKNKKIIAIVDKMVKGIYKNCDKILISSKRFSESILSKGDFLDRLIYFPNWSEDILRMDILNSSIPDLPKGFKIMIAGNLGTAQNLDSVSDVMLQLRDITELKWIFVGDGSKKRWLEQFIIDNKLENNAFCLGRFPFTSMPLFYKQADAMLVTLRPGFPHLGMVVPARLQSYMSAGRPILGMLGSGGADIINESDCGYVVPAGDSIALANIIRHKVLANKEAFAKKGSNGREFYLNNYTKDKCINDLCEIIS